MEISATPKGSVSEGSSFFPFLPTSCLPSSDLQRQETGKGSRRCCRKGKDGLHDFLRSLPEVKLTGKKSKPTNMIACVCVGDDEN